MPGVGVGVGLDVGDGVARSVGDGDGVGVAVGRGVGVGLGDGEGEGSDTKNSTVQFGTGLPSMARGFSGAVGATGASFPTRTTVNRVMTPSARLTRATNKIAQFFLTISINLVSTTCFGLLHELLPQI